MSYHKLQDWTSLIYEGWMILDLTLKKYTHKIWLEGVLSAQDNYP